MKGKIYLLLVVLSLSVQSYSQDYKETGLPICYITTQDQREIVSKQEYMDASMTLVDGKDTVLANAVVSIRGRGNATWYSYPKKPYKLKFSKNMTILSTYGKHFALLPNYCDKSLMRAAIGFKTCRLLDMEWVPADDYVELVLNGEYIGNYQLVETVRANKNRIQVSDTGFLLQYDRYWYADDPVYFFSETYGYPMIVKEPDEDVITDDQLNDIKGAMNDFETALAKGSYLWDQIDLKSFATWYYAANLLMLLDSNYYFYKYDNTGKSPICIGPLWDFEWSLGIGWYEGTERPNPNHELISECYFAQLCQNDFFIEQVKGLHQEYGEKVKEELLAYYDELANKLQKSQRLNFERWPVLDELVSVGGYPLGSWEAEVACDKAFFTAHYNYLDALFGSASNVHSLSATREHLQTIYNLGGQRVRQSGLRKGVYIRGRKKVVM